MDPGGPSKRARLGPHLNPLGHAPGTNPHSQPSSSATSANQLNPQAPTPVPPVAAPSSSASKHTGAFRPKNPFKALAKVATVIPPLQPVVDLLAEGMDSLSISSENSQNYDTFSANITKTIETLKWHLNNPNPVALTESMSDTIEELKKQAEYISKKQGQSGRKRLMDAERDEADLMRCYQNVDALLHRLNIDIGITVSRISNETLGVASRGVDVASAGLDVANQTFNLISEQQLDAPLAELAPVKEARYDAGKVRRNKCTPDTRVSVLEDLSNWANDENGARIYWMNGMAGTGKTTIACSLCNMLRTTNQLAASFFCSRQLPGCRDISRIIPTLSYQLARVSAPFKRQLCQVLKQDPDICSADVARQFEMLIYEPLRKVDQIVRANRLVIVIDALDECSDNSGAQMILDALFQFASDLPVKFFVTCRPEPTLFSRVSSGKQAIPSIFHLHNIEHSVIQADIETYLDAELAPIGASDQQIKSLAERSGKLFIYAATAVQYIRPTNARVDPQSRLQTILGVAPKYSNKVHEQLDELYTTILCAALENKALEPLEAANIKLVLHTILCTREPLTIEGLACLLRLKSVKEARLALEPLGSVLCVSDNHLPVSTLHASFPDYMLDQERSNRFWFDPATHHEILSGQCFALMKDLLRFNICGLESSFVPDVAVPNLSNRVERAIPSHLFYACRHWNEHLVLSCNVNVHAPILDEFLSNRILFWVEVMSLKRCIGLAASILSDLYGWMKRANMADGTCALCLDAQRFATVFGVSPACTSTPHLYISILALWNRDGAMWTQYGTRMMGIVVAAGSALNNRESGPLVSWRTGNRITSAAVSHDGRRVVTGSEDGQLHVWGTYTGTLLVGPFIGHTGRVRSVAFSPDDSRIASASYDHTLRVWDAHTACMLGAPFEGHQSPVSCVAFSPDGSRLASGSEDWTIRIWDTHTGQTVAGPCKEHTDRVCSITYAPDGGCIVSASRDGSICIWDPQTGHLVTRPLEGSQSPVLSIAFSPDSSLFASSFDSGDICVWDTQFWQIVRDFSCAPWDYARSIAFNPDGNNIVYYHQGGNICVWDVETGHQVSEYSTGSWALTSALAYLPNGYHIFAAFDDGTVFIWDTQGWQSHSNAAAVRVGLAVKSVHFSPDSRRIAGGCNDGTIRIWDAHTGNALVGPFKACTFGVDSVAFSSDGSRIASSGYGTICIWDTQTGRRVVGPLEGHTSFVCCVAYSPDGSRLVSGSGNHTVRVWDSQTGRALGGPFEGHTDEVLSVAYSPDGQRVVSGSVNGTVRVWDAHIGQTVVGPLKGHHAWVSSVAFSPNGSRIVSGSNDQTLRVWDAQTGQGVGEPFQGHTNRVTSVAYSPNGSHIASGSWDCTVRVWDAETGRIVAGPFKAHTDSVTSVAYSPDGSCFASGSDDGTIRIWRSETDSDGVDPLENWTMNKDGWVVDGDSSLLCWVPQDLRTALMWPQNRAFIRSEGVLRLNFHDACVGSRWTECFSR